MWIDLTPELLLRRVSAPERDALTSVATDISQSQVLEDTAAMVAADWRAGLRRICAPDKRPLRVPDELLNHILADYRYRSFTRLPGMSDLLDALRVREFDRAMEVRDSLTKWSVASPEEGYAEGDDGDTSSAPGRPTPIIADPDATSILG